MGRVRHQSHGVQPSGGNGELRIHAGRSLAVNHKKLTLGGVEKAMTYPSGAEQLGGEVGEDGGRVDGAGSRGHQDRRQHPGDVLVGKEGGEWGHVRRQQSTPTRSNVRGKSPLRDPLPVPVQGEGLQKVPTSHPPTAATAPPTTPPQRAAHLVKDLEGAALALLGGELLHLQATCKDKLSPLACDLLSTSALEGVIPSLSFSSPCGWQPGPTQHRASLPPNLDGTMRGQCPGRTRTWHSGPDLLPATSLI